MVNIFYIDIPKKYYTLGCCDYFWDNDDIPDVKLVFKYANAYGHHTKIEKIIRDGDIICLNGCGENRGDGALIYYDDKLHGLDSGDYDDYPCIPLYAWEKFNLPLNHFDDDNMIHIDAYGEINGYFNLHDTNTSESMLECPFYDKNKKLDRRFLKVIDLNMKYLYFVENFDSIFNEIQEKIKVAGDLTKD